MNNTEACKKLSDKKFVTYEEFGAVGDGVANDFAAIYAAHEYANANGLDVKADGTKTYRISDTRIGGEVKTVKIRTNVYWGDAKFTIDDSDIPIPDTTGMGRADIFLVESDYEKLVIEDPEILKAAAGIHPGVKKIELKLGYPAMIDPFYDGHRVYKRRGSSYNNAGGAQHEVILIDGEGNIDESTPIIFTYDALDKIVVYRTDMPHLVIDGGTFTTVVPKANIFYTNSEGKYVIGGYFGRGIAVKRSYTTVKNVKHYVEGEVSPREQVESNYHRGSVHYYGFFCAENGTDITFEGCVLTGRRCYKTPEGLTNYNGTMGTYDFTAYGVNKIHLVNCDQHNFYVNKYTAEACDENDPDAVLSMDFIPNTEKGVWAKICWGIGGSNMCKNMEYRGSRLSRFDAHAGMYHGKVVDSTINAISVVGNGNMTVENTRFISGGKGPVNNSFIYLRDDYGATWEGDIVIKNCTAETDEKYLYMANTSWANWDYGYKCFLPNITIDNFVLKAKPDTRVDIFSSHSFRENPEFYLDTFSDGTKNDNKVYAPEYIRVVNNKSNQDFYLFDSPVFDSTELVGNIVKE